MKTDKFTLFLYKNDTEFVTEFPCLLGHPVFSSRKIQKSLKIILIKNGRRTRNSNWYLYKSWNSEIPSTLSRLSYFCLITPPPLWFWDRGVWYMSLASLLPIHKKWISYFNGIQPVSNQLSPPCLVWPQTCVGPQISWNVGNDHSTWSTCFNLTNTHGFNTAGPGSIPGICEGRWICGAEVMV